jgi:hypothetical protein
MQDVRAPGGGKACRRYTVEVLSNSKMEEEIQSMRVERNDFGFSKKIDMMLKVVFVNSHNHDERDNKERTRRGPKGACDRE